MTSHLLSTNKQQSPQIAPFAVLRAHPAPITACEYLPFRLPNDCSYLASADEAGFVYVWSLNVKRPISVFRPHQQAIIGLKFVVLKSVASNSGDPENSLQTVSRILLISHSRDHSIKVFDTTFCIFTDSSYPFSNTYSTLPIDHSISHEPDQRNIPTQIYELPVNALNFCSVQVSIIEPYVNTKNDLQSSSYHTLLIAIPSTLASENVDVYTLTLSSFPILEYSSTPFDLDKASKDCIIRRICAGIPGPNFPKEFFKKETKQKIDLNKELNFGPGEGEDDGLDQELKQKLQDSIDPPRPDSTGIVMSLALTQLYSSASNTPSFHYFNLVVGYESGHVAIFQLSIPTWVSSESPASLKDSSTDPSNNGTASCKLLSAAQEHKQAVLCLEITELPLKTDTSGKYIENKLDGSQSIQKVLFSGSADSKIACTVLPLEPSMDIQNPSNDNNTGINIQIPEPGITSPQNDSKVLNAHQNDTISKDTAPILFSKKKVLATQPSSSSRQSLKSNLSEKLAFKPKVGTETKSDVTTNPFSFSPNTFSVSPLPSPGTSSVALRGDHKLLATSGWDGLVRIFSTPKSFYITALNGNATNPKYIQGGPVQQFSKGFVSSYGPVQPPTTKPHANKQSKSGSLLKPLASFKPSSHNYHQQSLTDSSSSRNSNVVNSSSSKSVDALVGDELSSISFGPLEWQSASFDLDTIQRYEKEMGQSLVTKRNRVQESLLASQLALGKKPGNVLAVARKDGRIGLYSVY